MKYIMMVVFTILLSGCMSGDYQWDKNAMEHNKLNFIGVPTVLGLGFSGSSTPITNKMSITNDHVATMLLKSTIKTHDKCDIALISQNNQNEKLPSLNYAKVGEDITFYGYSGLTLMPVSSKGKILNMVKNKNGCLVMETNAGGVAGMSGGSAFNKNGELVGIIYGVNMKNLHTMIIPIQSFLDYLPIEIQDNVKNKNKIDFR